MLSYARLRLFIGLFGIDFSGLSWKGVNAEVKHGMFRQTVVDFFCFITFHNVI
jgi:hypothetical protein